MIFSNGKSNCVVRQAAAGRKTVRTVRADGKEIRGTETRPKGR
jgi:hypothetical protein